MQLIKKYFGVIFVVALSFWAVRSLFVPGFFPIHDDEQIGRLYDLYQSLAAGHFPPRLVPNLGFGYGYPFFNFYPHFAYYIALIFKLIGFSYIDSIKLMMISGFVFAAIAMYYLSKEFFGKLGGVVSAVAYTYAPYHALDSYVRGALAEFWSFVFLPLQFLFFYKLYQTFNYKYVVFLGLVNAGLILTHNLVALMSVPFIGIFLLVLFFSTSKRAVFFVQSLISVLLGLGLSAYFWIPSLLEKQYTLVDILTKELANYNLHFVYIRQFWNSSWGFGGSIYGLLDGISFEVGKIHLIFVIVAVIISIKLLKSKTQSGNILLLFIIFFFLSLFLATFRSKFFWDLVPPLWYVQFPWRFLVFSVLFSSFLMGSISYITSKGNIRVYIGIAVIFFLIVANKDYFKPSEYLYGKVDSDYTKPEIIRFETSKLAFEYVPKGIATYKSDIDTTQVDINRESIAKESYEVVKGEMDVRVIKNNVHSKEFQILSKASGEFRINTFSFPGWKVYVDSKQVSYRDNNKLKLISVDMPIGEHIVKAEFTDTLVRRIANYISLFSIISLGIFSLVKLKRLLV